MLNKLLTLLRSIFSAPVDAASLRPPVPHAKTSTQENLPSSAGVALAPTPAPAPAASSTAGIVAEKPLIDLDLPSPAALRRGWAALAAVYAARGWDRDVYAEPRQWLYDDGGGNWACLRYVDKDRILLIGHDHEYSQTYFGEAAEYFGESETDLLAGAPAWWRSHLDPMPFGDWIGFVYGWDGRKWQRASYEAQDGFEQVGLLKACSLGTTETLIGCAQEAPGHDDEHPAHEAIAALLAADAEVTESLLDAVVPGWDSKAGANAALKFLEMPL